MLTYGNHFVGNNYLLSGAPEKIDITGTNKFIPGRLEQAIGNGVASMWMSGSMYFSANNDLPQKYKYAITAMRDIWDWRTTGEWPSTAADDPSHYVPDRYDTYSSDSGYALDLHGYTANIRTNIIISGTYRKQYTSSNDFNAIISGAFFDNDRLVTAMSDTFAVTGSAYCGTSISINVNNLIFSGRPNFKYIISSDAPYTMHNNIHVRVIDIRSLNNLSYSITATAAK